MILTPNTFFTFCMQMDTAESRVSSEDSGAKEEMEANQELQEAAATAAAEKKAKDEAKQAKEDEKRKKKKEIIEAEAIKKAKAREAKAREVEAKRNTEANEKTEAEEQERIRKVEAEEAEEEVEVEEEVEEVFPTPSHFFKDFNWTPHMYDSKEPSFTAGCPRGGPGGLICCESCAAQYSNFLSGTTRDIEQQKAAKMGGEMTELLGFLSNAKKLLGQSVRVARRKPVPMPRVNLKALYDPSTQTSADPEEQNDDVRDTAEV
jgi:chemotaxis protein histidine kinase CheA